MSFDESMAKIIEMATEEFRKHLKCPICGKKDIMLVDEMENLNIDAAKRWKACDQYECRSCGLVFIIPYESAWEFFISFMKVKR
jgi:transcription elongation factor Elf1